MSSSTRDSALAILRKPAGHSPLAVHNAIVDLRRNAQAGDEELLQQYLDFPDDMVVSATLFAFIHVYAPLPGLFDLLLRLADGDSRDNCEMPIQTQAIEGLALYSRENSNAISKLLLVARDSATPEAPRARAWERLADLFGVPWQRKHTEVMILEPESVTSQSIRQAVLDAIEKRNGKPLPA